jgi:hypothetical protein
MTLPKSSTIRPLNFPHIFRSKMVLISVSGAFAEFGSANSRRSRLRQRKGNILRSRLDGVSDELLFSQRAFLICIKKYRLQEL